MATERHIQANRANAAKSGLARETPPIQLTTESKDDDFRTEANSKSSRTQESDLERVNYALHWNSPH